MNLMLKKLHNESDYMNENVWSIIILHYTVINILKEHKR